MLDLFRKFLQGQELSESTLRSYLYAVQYFNEHYKGLNQKNLLAYKGYLVEHFKPPFFWKKVKNSGSTIAPQKIRAISLRTMR